MTSKSANPKLFILFRIFFNCRFYYPVYAILFLDFGLSAEQFAKLNVAWAIAIVLLEVPSGALADQLGRRTLVILAAILMVIEMTILAAMPVVDRLDFEGDPDGLNNAIFWLYLVFMANRVISGAAEAAASGADEALAYDSLDEENRDSLWTKLTKQLMIWQSVGFILVTLIGAALYDPEVVNRVAGWFGSEAKFVQAQTLKFPIYLTLGMALITLGIALKMRETEEMRPHPDLNLRDSIRASFKRTFAAGGWILKTPAALMLILIGLFYDSIIRLYYTVGSIWLEVIGYQPAWFGVISVAGSLMGILAAFIGGRLIEKCKPSLNFRILAALVFIGIFSLAFPIQYWSVLFLPALWISMRLLHFFLSNYLNRVTSSEKRATVLSFRGLTMNLFYGMMTYLYGLQTAFLLGRIGPEDPEALSKEERRELGHRVFEEAASWWWIYLAAGMLALFLFRWLKVRKSWNDLIPCDEKSDAG
ncbi:MAG: MFS transporter [Verrucomicrobiales bacterium]|nr:MFS transporter [Verrucomicrobiales bacterium]